MKIAKDVYKIHGEGNVYLITKPVPTLIDTGRKAEKENIVEEIEKVIPLNEIKIVLLTHLHYDHCENLPLFSKAKIYAAKEEIEDFKKSKGLFFFGKIFGPVHKLINKMKPLPKKISGLEVIKVPGHTKGSVAFVDNERKLLFSGDTLFENTIGRTDLPNSVPEKMKYSVDKLINLIHDRHLTLCPGHDY